MLAELRAAATTYGPGLRERVAALVPAGADAEQRHFTVPVAAAFPLEDAADAQRLSETGRARGKIVLTH